MSALLIAALVIASPDYDLSWKGGLSSSGGTISGNLSITGALDVGGETLLNDNLILNCPLCVIYTLGQTTDTAGVDLKVHAGAAWGNNKAGGDLLIGGGAGSVLITVTDETVGDDDVVTIVIDGTSSTCTEGVVGANGFDCEPDNDTCATNLATCMHAKTGISASATGAVVNVTPDVGTFSVRLSIADGGADGVFGVNTKGADGHIYVPTGATNFVSIGGIGDNDTGLGFEGNNKLTIITNGSKRFLCDTTYCYVFQDFVQGSGRFYGAATPLLLGTTATTSHALSTSDVLTGGKLEVNGALYADGNIIQSTAKGASAQIIPSVKSATFPANPGAATAVTSGLCPANSIIVGITYRVSTAATNCASVEIGDGADIDMFGTAQAITQGTTGDLSDYTDATTYVMQYSSGAVEATVTANGGNCYDGVWRFTCEYINLSADTSN